MHRFGGTVHISILIWNRIKLCHNNKYKIPIREWIEKKIFKSKSWSPFLIKDFPTLIPVFLCRLFIWIQCYNSNTNIKRCWLLLVSNTFSTWACNLKHSENLKITEKMLDILKNWSNHEKVFLMKSKLDIVRTKKCGTLHDFACHPCAGAMLIFSVSFQF